jgi:uncharacterized protein
MKNGSIDLRMRGIYIEDDEPIVVLEDRVTDRRLMIRVGPFEASAIIIELEGITPPRPMTHDLLAQFFEEGGFSLDAVQFFGDVSSEVRARLLYRKGLRKFTKEIRPVDALALALRLGAPLSADRHLLELQERDLPPQQRPRIVALDEWRTRSMRA